MKGITEKQKRFCEEYMIDYNATRAYKAVYKNCKKDESARANASKLLTNTNVKTYIENLLEEIHSEKTADAREVMEYLTSVMRGETKDKTLIWVGDGVQNITDINVSTKEKLKAAELLGKRFGLFKEKVEVEGDIPIVIKGGGELEE